jgi:hypothetical protein
VRVVHDYHVNTDVLKPVPTFVSVAGGSLAAPYVRWHPPLPGMYDDNQQPEYDVDEADDAWLAKANAEAEGGGAGGGGGGRGLMAAARGLYATVASRFRSASDAGVSDAGGGPGAGGSGAGGSSNCTGGGLSVVDFERAIDKLELLHFAAVSKWWTDVNDGERADS